MPLTRHQVTVGVGGANEVTIEVEPFEWPRHNWEILDLQASRETSLITADLTKLRNLYNNAHGQILRGLAGLIVQFVEGTGGAAFTVTDWRGNTGSFVFMPDEGLDIQEVAGSADEALPLGSAYHEVRLRLVRV